VVGLVEVGDVGVNPTSDLVLQATVNVDADTVVEKVATRLKTQLDGVELVEWRAAGRVDAGHIQPFSRFAAAVSCKYTAFTKHSLTFLA